MLDHRVMGALGAGERSLAICRVIQAGALASVLLLLLLPAPALSAGKLHTRYGFAIDAETWWERGGILYYQRRGATQVIPRSDVLRIEGVPDQQQPAAAVPQSPAAAVPPPRPGFCLAGTAPVVTRADLQFMARMNEALPRIADDSTRATIADRLATCTRFMHQALDGLPVDPGDLRAYCCP